MKIPEEALKIKGITYVKKYPYGELEKVSKESEPNIKDCSSHENCNKYN